MRCTHNQDNGGAIELYPLINFDFPYILKSLLDYG